MPPVYWMKPNSNKPSSIKLRNFIRNEFRHTKTKSANNDFVLSPTSPISSAYTFIYQCVSAIFSIALLICLLIIKSIVAVFQLRLIERFLLTPRPCNNSAIPSHCGINLGSFTGIPGIMLTRDSGPRLTCRTSIIYGFTFLSAFAIDMCAREQFPGSTIETVQIPIRCPVTSGNKKSVKCERGNATSPMRLKKLRFQLAPVGSLIATYPSARLPSIAS